MSHTEPEEPDVPTDEIGQAQAAVEEESMSAA